jgi:uncharacterized protein (TIRG00374 family)
MIKNLILFVLLICLTFYLILRNQNINDILNILKGVKKEYILIGIIFMLGYLICETINLDRTLKVLKEKSTFIRNFKYVLIGFFFSAITPAASGGQPMQIYYMHKDKISVANSTLALLINLCSFQIITISIALISLFFNQVFLDSNLIWFFILGITLNLGALALLLIGIFSKKLSSALIRFAVKILNVFKVKNIEQKQEKLENELNMYHKSANYIKKHKKMMLKTILTTFVQILIYYSIPYWVYRAFSFNTYNIIKLISLQSILYATVSGIPLPGAVGVSEGGFISIFKAVFTPEKVNSAMLLNRGISFYLFVIISGILVITEILKRRNDKDKEKEIKENTKKAI